MDFPISINWKSTFPILGLLGGISHFHSNFNTCKTFRRQTVENLIWFCTVCRCPTKFPANIHSFSECRFCLRLILCLSPPVIILLTVLRWCFFCGSFLLFVFVLFSCLFLAALCSGEWADLLAFLYVMFSYVFVTFPYGVPGKVWYLIVSNPDLFLLPYLASSADPQ